MPIKIEWQTSLSLLTMTYTGTISRNDYISMLDQRRATLESAAGPVILLADIRELEGFAHPEAANLHPSILRDKRVHSLLIVLRQEVYHALLYSINHHSTKGLKVRFYANMNDALEAARTLIPPPT